MSMVLAVNQNKLQFCKVLIVISNNQNIYIYIYMKFVSILKINVFCTCSVCHFSMIFLPSFPVLDQFLVENEQQQRQRLEDRIARRKQLIAEREAEGLSTDDTTINNIIEQEEEEENKKRRRVGCG